MLRWCERHSVDYVVGLARNSRLQTKAEKGFVIARQTVMSWPEKQRFFMPLAYATDSWGKRSLRRRQNRKVSVGIIRLHRDEFAGGKAKGTLSDLYCAWGEWKTASKISSWTCLQIAPPARWWVNQWRMLLSGFAYELFEELRKLLKAKQSWPAHPSIHCDSNWWNWAQSSFGIPAYSVYAEASLSWTRVFAGLIRRGIPENERAALTWKIGVMGMLRLWNWKGSGPENCIIRSIKATDKNQNRIDYR